MEARNKIIEQILLEAKADCDAIISEKDRQAQAALADSEKHIEHRRQEVEQKCKAVREEILKNAAGSAQLEWKKYRLESKRGLIDKCFDDAHKKLSALEGKSYLDLVGKLLKQYAVKGDTVLIAQKDSKVITQEFLDGLKLSLKLSDNFADIDGGVVLNSKNYDINLSLSVLTEMIKEKTEVEVSKILFGGE